MMSPNDQAQYQPVGVPAPVAKHPGMILGTVGLVCAAVSLFLLPPIFGIAGIILGILSMKRGERILGVVAIVLSTLFMIVGTLFGIYVSIHPELFEPKASAASGVLIKPLLEYSKSDSL